MSRTMNLLLVVVLLLALALNSLPLPAHAMTPSAYIQWFHLFSAATSRPENDSASAVAVSGDYLYVVGYKYEGGGVANLYKYDVNGNQLWSRQFGRFLVQASDVVVDTSGVYMVGQTYEDLSGQTHLGYGDAYIRKYDVDGNQLWTRLFGSSSRDSADGIAVDNSGVYIVGAIEGTLPGQTSAGGNDAYIRKYDVGGNEVWTRQFGSPSGDGNSDVAVDGSGVYVVGGTGGTFPGQTSAGGNDAFIRKYDVNGNEVWTRQFGSSSGEWASGVVVDSSGVYVAGQTGGTLSDQTSSGESDAYIRRYDASGNEVWTRQFGSSSSDYANAVAVDDSGVHVAGRTDGALPGQASSGEEDAYIRKYDTSGNELWTHQFGSSSYESAYGIAVDNSETYMVGATRGTLPGQTSFGLGDAFIRKYDTSGSELWTRQFGGLIPVLYSTSAQAIAANGSIYVVGNTAGPLPGQTYLGEQDTYIRKYDANGSELWTRQFGTSANESAIGIAVDNSGIYVLGETNGIFPDQTSAWDKDAYIRKYDVDGNEVWTRQFGYSMSDTASGIAVDSSGIYVAGSTGGTLPGQTSSGESDAYVRKYNVDGNEVWSRQFGSSASDRVRGIAVGNSGVYLVGDTNGTLPGQTSSGRFDAFVRKYDFEGNDIWSRQFGSSAEDAAIGVAVDSASIYVIGNMNGMWPSQNRSEFDPDAFIHKYDVNGNELWTRQFRPPEYSYAHRIAIDNSGIYVAGNTGGTLPGQISSGNGDGFVRKYDAEGSKVWTKQFGSSSSESVYGVAVDDSGVYVAGATGNPTDAFIAKLTRDSISLSFLYLPVVNH